MNVLYRGNLKTIFESTRRLERKFGVMHHKLINLMNTFRTMNPTDLYNLPGNPHPLKFQHKGVYSVTVNHPFRCVFHLNPINETITVLDIINYHDHTMKTYSLD